MDLKLHLHLKQGTALQSSATEILYGGAAGSGKSHLLRVVAILLSLQVAGIQVYLFRRKYPDLLANHIDGPTGFPAILAELIDKGKCSLNLSKMEISFWNGSKIHLCHCQHEKDVINYQGAEIHVLLIDELTHFTEYQYRFLRGRLRLGALNVPDNLKGQLPKIISGSNPGSVGHQWVKRTFIDSQQPLEIKKQDKKEGGLVRQFIPALLEDNPTLNDNDPDYESRLEGLGSPELVKAMRWGIWDITAGAAFEKLSREIHLVRPFKVPQHWTKFMSMDWGSAKPFSVGWYCVADDTLELKAKDSWPKRIIPKGAIIRYREWYGWNGKPDEGIRAESFEVARKILEIEEESMEEIDYRVGDTSMWASQDGPSVQERMYDATDGLFQMQQSIKDRESNYQEMRARLVGEDGYPMFYATANCLNFWRTVPDLQLDERHPEKGPDSTQEDHVWDEVAYAIASRPYITTLRDRVKTEKDRALKSYRKQKGY
jgi:hypothetical protein